MEDLLFAVAVAAYLLAGLAWPTLRVWRRTGIWPIVFNRQAAPIQRGLGVLFDALFLGLLALAILRAAVGADALGIPPPSAATRIAGWGLLLAGGGLTLVAQRQMGAAWRVGIDDRPTDLVTSGLFRHVRNPIFSGLLALAAGVVILSPAWWSVVVWILTAVGLRLQVTWEERHLIALHGDAYRVYAARAGRFVPFVGRLRAAAWAGAGRAPAAPGG